MDDVWQLIARDYVKDLETSTALGCVCRAWRKLPRMKTVGEMLRAGEQLPDKYSNHITRHMSLRHKYNWRRLRMSASILTDDIMTMMGSPGTTEYEHVAEVKYCARLYSIDDVFQELCRGNPFHFTHHAHYAEGKIRRGPALYHGGIRWMLEECKKLVDLETGFLTACENGDMAIAHLVCPPVADRVKARAVYIAAAREDGRIIDLLVAHGANLGRRDYVRARREGSVEVAELILSYAPHIRIPWWLRL
jgi:hypothetical protein